MRIAVPMAVVMLALLPACGPYPGSQPTPTPAPLVPLPTVPPMGDDVLAIYNRSGCFAGIDDTLTVHQQGALELVDRQGALKQARVAPEALQAVRQLLSSPAYAALSPLYQSSGADLCVYHISARDAGGRPRMVTTMDGAQYPDVLAQTIGEFEKLRGQVR